MSAIVFKENGPFKPENAKDITKSFDLAVLYNLELAQDEIDNIVLPNVIKLNTIDLCLDTFLSLFFNTYTKYFSINKANVYNDLILFNKQTYASNNNNKNHYSLNDQILHSYGILHNIDVENISFDKKILVNKEAFQLQSLSKLRGTLIALDWDQVIQALIENKYILRSPNPLSVATVVFNIAANVFSKSLKVWTTVIFPYRTKLNGYKNVGEDEHIKPYSDVCSEPVKPFYSSSYVDYEGDSDNGVSLSKGSDNGESRVSFKSEKHVVLDVEEDLDENSVIYTINDSLLNKINKIKNNSDESICTWLKNE
jgi:hypothetical protein